MSVFDILLIGIGLSADAFAISVCKGLSARRFDGKTALCCGLWFGGFQAFMPILGFLLGSTVSNFISSFSGILAFVLLLVIGLNMIKEARQDTADCGCGGEACTAGSSDRGYGNGALENGLSAVSAYEAMPAGAGAFGTVSGAAGSAETASVRRPVSAVQSHGVRTGGREMFSLALATSIDALAVGVSFAAYRMNILSSALLIGMTTLLISIGGVKIGAVFGGRFKQKAEYLGGAILILIGVKLLLGL